MRQNYTTSFLSLVLGQMVICNFFHLSSYVLLSILPVAVLCLPTKVGTKTGMFIALGASFIIDWLAEGTLGLNMTAILPVAAIRKPLCRQIFGPELEEMDEDFSVNKYGLLKVAAAVVICQALFLVIYIMADGASLRPLLFNLERFGASLVLGSALSIILADSLSPNR